jgi:nitroreductase
MSLNQHIQSRYGLPTATGQGIDANETVTNILTRRSHRAFSGKPVSQDLLDTLFATAFSAPSKSDLQQACVIHVRDKTKQLHIAEASASTRWAADAPVLLVWCGDSRRIRRLADWRGKISAVTYVDRVSTWIEIREDTCLNLQES